jgi:hypothetical protein
MTRKLLSTSSLFAALLLSATASPTMAGITASFDCVVTETFSVSTGSITQFLLVDPRGASTKAANGDGTSSVTMPPKAPTFTGTTATFGEIMGTASATTGFASAQATSDSDGSFHLFNNTNAPEMVTVTVTIAATLKGMASPGGHPLLT